MVSIHHTQCIAFYMLYVFFLYGSNDNVSLLQLCNAGARSLFNATDIMACFDQSFMQYLLPHVLLQALREHNGYDNHQQV